MENMVDNEIVVEYRLVAAGSTSRSSVFIDWFEGQDPHVDGKRQEIQVGLSTAVSQSLTEDWEEKEVTFDHAGTPTMYKLRRIDAHRGRGTSAGS